MKLVYKDNHEPVKYGDMVFTSDGQKFSVDSWKEPHKPSSSGFVYLTDEAGNNRQYYPSVVGLEFYPRMDREEFGPVSIISEKQT